MCYQTCCIDILLDLQPFGYNLNKVITTMVIRPLDDPT